MLFEVVLRIIVAPGKDSVTPEESADGFKSEWASLPIPIAASTCHCARKIAGRRRNAGARSVCPSRN